VIKELAYYTRRLPDAAPARRSRNKGVGQNVSSAFLPRFFPPNRAEENAHLCADSRGGVAERRTSFRVFFFSASFFERRNRTRRILIREKKAFSSEPSSA
jgi:hypothetical protein